MVSHERSSAILILLWALVSTGTILVMSSDQLEDIDPEKFTFGAACGISFVSIFLLFALHFPYLRSNGSKIQDCPPYTPSQSLHFAGPGLHFAGSAGSNLGIPVFHQRPDGDRKESLPMAEGESIPGASLA